MEAKKQPPGYNFQELADGLAEGREMGTPTFNHFLKLGVSHWGNLASRGGVFAVTYQRLALKYAKALQGAVKEKTEFCEDEASYLLENAAVCQRLGNVEAAKQLETRAGNWQTLAMSFTQTGR